MLKSSKAFLNTTTSVITSIYAELNSGCTCPGDLLTYECTAMGTASGVTVWSGTAIKCQYSSDMIILLFNSYYGIMCNNGDIMAKDISLEGNNYTSQLNITVTPDRFGKTIECLYDGGNGIITLLSSWEIPRTGLSYYHISTGQNTVLTNIDYTYTTLQTQFHLPIYM